MRILDIIIALISIIAASALGCFGVAYLVIGIDTINIAHCIAGMLSIIVANWYLINLSDIWEEI